MYSTTERDSQSGINSTERSIVFKLAIGKPKIVQLSRLYDLGIKSLRSLLNNNEIHFARYGMKKMFFITNKENLNKCFLKVVFNINHESGEYDMHGGEMVEKKCIDGYAELEKLAKLNHQEIVPLLVDHRMIKLRVKKLHYSLRPKFEGLINAKISSIVFKYPYDIEETGVFSDVCSFSIPRSCAGEMVVVVNSNLFKNCVFEEIKPIGKQKNIICVKCAKEGHTARTCTFKGIICYNCGEEGHFSKVCTKKFVHCIFCHSNAHKSHLCPHCHPRVVPFVIADYVHVNDAWTEWDDDVQVMSTSTSTSTTIASSTTTNTAKDMYVSSTNALSVGNDVSMKDVKEEKREVKDDVGRHVLDDVKSHVDECMKAVNKSIGELQHSYDSKLKDFMKEIDHKLEEIVKLHSMNEKIYELKHVSNPTTTTSSTTNTTTASTSTTTPSISTTTSVSATISASSTSITTSGNKSTSTTETKTSLVPTSFDHPTHQRQRTTKSSRNLRSISAKPGGTLASIGNATTSSITSFSSSSISSLPSNSNSVSSISSNSVSTLSSTTTSSK
jgi:hypothetical protein